MARAAGETAPLLIVDGIFTPQLSFQIFGHAVPNIPVSIFTAAEAADPNGFTRAWGEALVLLALILIANVGARVFLARQRARMGSMSVGEPSVAASRIQDRPVAARLRSLCR